MTSIFIWYILAVLSNKQLDSLDTEPSVNTYAKVGGKQKIRASKHASIMKTSRLTITYGFGK